MTAHTAITAQDVVGTRHAEITDLSDKRWHVRVRDGMPFEVRRWGSAQGAIAMGGAHYFATLSAANEAAARWFGEGR